MIEIDISTHAGSWPDVEDLIKAAIHETARKFDLKAHDVSIVLADNAFIQDLNKTYRGQDKPTNVLSFPQDIEESLGDVILALETLNKECKEQKKSFNDHLQHLVVHGFLHLLGHDHEQDHEAEEMEALEIEILNGLGVKNPYEAEKIMS